MKVGQSGKFQELSPSAVAKNYDETGPQENCSIDGTLKVTPAVKTLLNSGFVLVKLSLDCLSLTEKCLPPGGCLANCCEGFFFFNHPLVVFRGLPGSFFLNET